MKKLKLKAKDSHVCDSREECLIDDFLFQNGIEHKKVPFQWAMSQYFYEGMHSYPDWIIHGEFVEYLGLSGYADYDKKVERKINSAKKGKVYHFLMPYKAVFKDSCKIISIDANGRVALNNLDYRTYLLKRFKRHANMKLDFFL